MNDHNYSLAFSSVQDKVWGLHPAKLAELTALVVRLMLGERVEFLEAAAAKNGNRAQDDPYQVQGGVGVIPVYGVLDKRMNMFNNISGGTSYELLAQALQAALADPNVQAVLLDVDSPGGAVDGLKTLADQILAARDQKPVVAFANGQMSSSAYWLGSAANQVVAEPTALVGSIGVALTHFDRSAQDAQRGIKRTAIFSGKYKRIASDERPLTQEGQDYLQGLSDTYYGLFLDAVAKHRGTNAATVHATMADGRDFVGKQALDVGLVDQIGTKAYALALARELTTARSAPEGRKQPLKAIAGPDFMARVKNLMATGKNRTEAICFVARYFPELHDEYVMNLRRGA